MPDPVFTRDDVRDQLLRMGYKVVTEETLDQFMSRLGEIAPEDIEFDGEGEEFDGEYVEGDSYYIDDDPDPAATDQYDFSQHPDQEGLVFDDQEPYIEGSDNYVDYGAAYSVKDNADARSEYYTGHLSGHDQLGNSTLMLEDNQPELTDTMHASTSGNMEYTSPSNLHNSINGSDATQHDFHNAAEYTGKETDTGRLYNEWTPGPLGNASGRVADGGVGEIEQLHPSTGPTTNDHNTAAAQANILSSTLSESSGSSAARVTGTAPASIAAGGSGVGSYAGLDALRRYREQVAAQRRSIAPAQVGDRDHVDVEQTSGRGNVVPSHGLIHAEKGRMRSRWAPFVQHGVSSDEEGEDGADIEAEADGDVDGGVRNVSATGVRGTAWVGGDSREDFDWKSQERTHASREGDGSVEYSWKTDGAVSQAGSAWHDGEDTTNMGVEADESDAQWDEEQRTSESVEWGVKPTGVNAADAVETGKEDAWVDADDYAYEDDAFLLRGEHAGAYTGSAAVLGSEATAAGATPTIVSATAAVPASVAAAIHPVTAAAAASSSNTPTTTTPSNPSGSVSVGGMPTTSSASPSPLPFSLTLLPSVTPAIPRYRPRAIPNRLLFKSPLANRPRHQHLSPGALFDKYEHLYHDLRDPSAVDQFGRAVETVMREQHRAMVDKAQHTSAHPVAPDEDHAGSIGGVDNHEDGEHDEDYGDDAGVDTYAGEEFDSAEDHADIAEAHVEVGAEDMEGQEGSVRAGMGALDSIFKNVNGHALPPPSSFPPNPAHTPPLALHRHTVASAPPVPAAAIDSHATPTDVAFAKAERKDWVDAKEGQGVSELVHKNEAEEEEYPDDFETSPAASQQTLPVSTVSVSAGAQIQPHLPVHDVASAAATFTSGNSTPATILESSGSPAGSSTLLTPRARAALARAGVTEEEYIRYVLGSQRDTTSVTDTVDSPAASAYTDTSAAVRTSIPASTATTMPNSMAVSNDASASPAANTSLTAANISLTGHAGDICGAGGAGVEEGVEDLLNIDHAPHHTRSTDSSTTTVTATTVTGISAHRDVLALGVPAPVDTRAHPGIASRSAPYTVSQPQTQPQTLPRPLDMPSHRDFAAFLPASAMGTSPNHTRAKAIVSAQNSGGKPHARHGAPASAVAPTATAASAVRHGFAAPTASSQAASAHEVHSPALSTHAIALEDSFASLGESFDSTIEPRRIDFATTSPSSSHAQAPTSRISTSPSAPITTHTAISTPARTPPAASAPAGLATPTTASTTDIYARVGAVVLQALQAGQSLDPAALLQVLADAASASAQPSTGVAAPLSALASARTAAYATTNALAGVFMHPVAHTPLTSQLLTRDTLAAPSLPIPLPPHAPQSPGSPSIATRTPLAAPAPQPSRASASSGSLTPVPAAVRASGSASPGVPRVSPAPGITLLQPMAASPNGPPHIHATVFPSAPQHANTSAAVTASPHRVATSTTITTNASPATASASATFASAAASAASAVAANAPAKPIRDTSAVAAARTRSNTQNKQGPKVSATSAPQAAPRTATAATTATSAAVTAHRAPLAWTIDPPLPVAHMTHATQPTHATYAIPRSRSASRLRQPRVLPPRTMSPSEASDTPAAVPALTSISTSTSLARISAARPPSQRGVPSSAQHGRVQRPPSRSSANVDTSISLRRTSTARNHSASRNTSISRNPSSSRLRPQSSSRPRSTSRSRPSTSAGPRPTSPSRPARELSPSTRARLLVLEQDRREREREMMQRLREARQRAEEQEREAAAAAAAAKNAEREAKRAAARLHIAAQREGFRQQHAHAGVSAPKVVHRGGGAVERLPSEDADRRSSQPRTRSSSRMPKLTQTMQPHPTSTPSVSAAVSTSTNASSPNARRSTSRSRPSATRGVRAPAYATATAAPIYTYAAVASNRDQSTNAQREDTSRRRSSPCSRVQTQTLTRPRDLSTTGPLPGTSVFTSTPEFSRAQTHAHTPSRARARLNASAAAPLPDSARTTHATYTTLLAPHPDATHVSPGARDDVENTDTGHEMSRGGRVAGALPVDSTYADVDVSYMSAALSSRGEPLRSPYLTQHHSPRASHTADTPHTSHHQSLQSNHALLRSPHDRHPAQHESLHGASAVRPGVAAPARPRPLPSSGFSPTHATGSASLHASHTTPSSTSTFTSSPGVAPEPLSARLAQLNLSSGDVSALLAACETNQLHTLDSRQQQLVGALLDALAASRRSTTATSVNRGEASRTVISNGSSSDATVSSDLIGNAGFKRATERSVEFSNNVDLSFYEADEAEESPAHGGYVEDEDAEADAYVAALVADSNSNPATHDLNNTNDARDGTHVGTFADYSLDARVAHAYHNTSSHSFPSPPPAPHALLPSSSPSLSRPSAKTSPADPFSVRYSPASLRNMVHRTDTAAPKPNVVHDSASSMVNRSSTSTANNGVDRGGMGLELVQEAATGSADTGGRYKSIGHVVEDTLIADPAGYASRTNEDEARRSGEGDSSDDRDDSHGNIASNHGKIRGRAGNSVIVPSDFQIPKVRRPSQRPRGDGYAHHRAHTQQPISEYPGTRRDSAQSRRESSQQRTSQQPPRQSSQHRSHHVHTSTVSSSRSVRPGSVGRKRTNVVDRHLAYREAWGTKTPSYMMAKR